MIQNHLLEFCWWEEAVFPSKSYILFHCLVWTVPIVQMFRRKTKLSLGSAACFVFPEYESPFSRVLFIVTGSPLVYTLMSLFKITEEKQQDTLHFKLESFQNVLEANSVPTCSNSLENNVTVLGREKG